MMHILPVTNMARIEDWGDLVEDCARIRRGLRRDDNGNVVTPVQNVDNFVYLGELAYWEQTKNDPAKCPQAAAAAQQAAAQGNLQAGILGFRPVPSRRVETITGGRWQRCGVDSGERDSIPS